MQVSAPRGARALLLLPSIGLLAVVLVLLFGLRERPLLWVEVYGGPTDVQGPERLRLHAQREEDGLTASAAGTRLSVRWQGPTSTSEALVTTGADGWAELELPRPQGSNRLNLQILEPATGAVLASGTPELPLERWRAAAARRGGRLVGTSTGPIETSGRIVEGVLVYPFVGQVELGFQLAPLGTEVDVTLEGASLEGPAHFMLGDLNLATLRLRPQGHLVTLELQLREPDGTDPSTFHAVLPVVPGAAWAGREPGGVRVRTAEPRAELWFAWASEAGRYAGGRLPLQAAVGNTSEAFLPEATWPAGEARYLVLASSADGRSPSTVGFPIDGQTATFDALDGHLLDGSTQVQLREQVRRTRLTRLLLGYVVLVGLLTVLLFLFEVRSADRELRHRMADAGVIELGPRRFTFAAWVASFCLVGAFTLLLVWVALGG